MTQSQYARKKRVHRSRISQLVREGRLILIGGKIDPTVADANWEKNIDPVKRYNLKTSKAGHGRKTKSSPSLSYIEAKRNHELLKSQLTALEVKIKTGELVPKGESLRWLSNHIIIAKTALWGLPRRMGPVLATVTDEKEIEFQLEEEIFEILEEMARSLPAGERAEILRDEGSDLAFEERLVRRKEMKNHEEKK